MSAIISSKELGTIKRINANPSKYLYKFTFGTIIKLNSWYIDKVVSTSIRRLSGNLLDKYAQYIKDKKVLSKKELHICFMIGTSFTIKGKISEIAIVKFLDRFDPICKNLSDDWSENYNEIKDIQSLS